MFTKNILSMFAPRRSLSININGCTQLTATRELKEGFLWRK